MSDDETNPQQRWHLDRRVSIGHLLTTAAVGVSAVLWLSDVEKRLSLNAQSIEVAVQRIDRIEARQATALTELKVEIRDGFAAMRLDLRMLTGRVDRQGERTTP